MLCENCFFYHPSKNLKGKASEFEGECHRYPPQVVCAPEIGEPAHLRNVRPRVFAGENCGEYRKDWRVNK